MIKLFRVDDPICGNFVRGRVLVRGVGGGITTLSLILLQHEAWCDAQSRKGETKSGEGEERGVNPIPH